jgi:hypothetical protein
LDFALAEEVPVATAPPLCSARYVWEYFCELHTQRGHSFGSFLPLSWTEIDAWSRLSRTPLSPWETRVLSLLDVTWRIAYAEQSSEGGAS